MSFKLLTRLQIRGSPAPLQGVGLAVTSGSDKTGAVTLGFVSAILPELNLEEVFSFAREAGFETVELMCWPRGKADRRYAGVTHVDVTSVEPQTMTGQVSALGYYPNPLCADEKEAELYINHLKQVISTAPKLGLDR
jgi:sugar phosphate isomerase/epimerase